MAAIKQKQKKLLKAGELPPFSQAIRPQAGPQEAFLSSPADIVIYGGGAGGGKSFGLLMEPLRHVITNKAFAAVIFRRNNTQVKNPGGLWDESMKMYPGAGAIPVGHVLEWRWPEGGKVKMAHLDHEDTVLDWQGAQIPLLGFDELTHFSENQFFYMLSRNRSTCGVRPYVRATTNPDANSWVAKFIEWWIDQETGFPIQERAGKLRWFIRLNDALIWADSREALVEQHGETARPKSVTFIPAKLSDNKKLTEKDPDYEANLKALSRVERARLLDGNWKVKLSAGMYFKRHEVTVVDTVPDDIVKLVRRWDLAATEPDPSNPDPDWTAGVLMGIRKNGRYIILNVVRERMKSHKVREMVKRVAINDGVKVRIGIPQDPGQAGKDQAESYVRDLAGFVTEPVRETGDKATRADPYAAQWQGGNIDVLRAPWNDAFFSEHEDFIGDGKTHDDQVDAGAGAFQMLTGSSLSVWAKLGK